LWVPACATTPCWVWNTCGSRVRYEACTLRLISAALHHTALQGLCETSFAKDSSRTHLSALASAKHAARNPKRIGCNLSTNLFEQMTEYQTIVWQVPNVAPSHQDYSHLSTGDISRGRKFSCTLPGRCHRHFLCNIPDPCSIGSRCLCPCIPVVAAVSKLIHIIHKFSGTAP